MLDFNLLESALANEISISDIRIVKRIVQILLADSSFLFCQTLMLDQIFVKIVV